MLSAVPPDASFVAKSVAAMRERSPLVQCFPNPAAADMIANVLLAAGAAPAMVCGLDEGTRQIRKVYGDGLWQRGR